MSTISSTTNTNLYRVGGIAAILGILLSLGYLILPAFLAIGTLAFAVFIFALYRLFRAESAGISLAAGVVGIGGAVLLATILLISGTQNNALQNTAVWAVFFSPPLFFGFLAYQHPRAGMSRTHALSGIIGGVAGLLNLILTLIGGGDWSNPNNPALAPLIMATYFIGMIFILVWLVWTCLVLLRRTT